MLLSMHSEIAVASSLELRLSTSMYVSSSNVVPRMLLRVGVVDAVDARRLEDHLAPISMARRLRPCRW